MSRLPIAVALAVLLTFAVPGSLCASDAAVPDDVFSMNVPDGYAPFTRQVQTTDSPEGKIEVTNWISKAPTGEAVVVTMSRMPGKIADPGKLMAGARDSLLKSLNATLEKEEPRPGDLPSSRLLFRTDAAWFRARFTVADDRLYQVLYVGRSAEQRDAAGVGTIFDSFRLNESQMATGSTAAEPAPVAAAPGQ